MSKKVIIAEDSSIIKSIFQKILSAHNYSIDCAKNGEEVLLKIKENVFDIILMDINMPVMDGISCTQAIREQESSSTSDIPIIGISGNPNNHTRDYYISVGFTDFVEKPINYDHVIRLIKELTK